MFSMKKLLTQTYQERIHYVVPTIGVEPTTYALQVRCSAIEPRRQEWWVLGVSNPRPLPCEGSALPLS